MSQTLPPDQDPIVLKAAAKALTKALGKQEIEQGSHPIQTTLTLSLAGVLEKAPPTEIQALPEVDWGAAFALLALRLKAKRPDAKRIAGEVLRAVIACPTDELPTARGIGDRIRDMREEIDLAREDGRKPKPREGETRWLGDCEIH